ncbi:hypothetical protein COLO4_09954 [Corchorus olitorius]|uniref:Uncharacterized protein n=1 Tax=Corchorus olitorius TaxID=93759 RepID=A0A1R3KAK4_9ROSI|nr:hypothetical protein COLO4_09954 [Corchorus olitorius]
MAPLMYFNVRKVFLLYFALFLLISMLLSASIESHELQSNRFGARRRLFELEEEDQQILLKKKNNQTKLIKSLNQSSKNQTKLIKSSLSSKNQTKLLKPTNSTKSTSLSSNSLSKKLNSTSSSQLKKLNSTSSSLLKKNLNSTSLLKKLNSTSKSSSSSLSTKKTSDLLKLNSPKNKTTTTKTLSDKKVSVSDTESSKSQKISNKEKNPITQKPKQQNKKQPSWIDQEDDSDLVEEFRDLPTKFQQTLIPDLEKISTTSKAYLDRYNKQITKQFKPYVGNKHAPTIATVISCAFILIPLLLVSLIFNRIKAYFSLQKILIFIQVYLSIYFSILCLTSLITGLEPLKFFYATSPSTYVCLQVLQTLGYVFYLLLLLMYLILVFSTESGMGSKMLGLGQTFVGFAVGLHYYVAVFHRVVLRQPPKTNWKVHGIYATCFLVVCLFAKADWRKKAYLEEGGEEGKKN